MKTVIAISTATTIMFSMTAAAQPNQRTPVLLKGPTPAERPTRNFGPNECAFLDAMHAAETRRGNAQAVADYAQQIAQQCRETNTEKAIS